MKNRWHFYIILLLWVFTSQTSQAQAILKKRISVLVHEVSYSTALETIGDKAGVIFNYSNSFLPKTKVSLAIQDSTLKYVLDTLLSSTELTYQVISNDEISIRNIPKRATKQQFFTISGRVTSAETGEELFATNVYERLGDFGTSTNQFGFYSISLPPGRYEFVFSYVNKYSIVDTVFLKKDMRLDIALVEKVHLLEGIDISGELFPRPNLDIPENSKIITPLIVALTPPLVGEHDPLKSLQLFDPSLQTAGEGTTGIFARGGGADQNLILLDGAPIYSYGHTLGLVSILNPDIIKDIEVYTGGIPSKYGGRLSSVIDARTREGNKKKREITGGVGLIAGRLTYEQPFDKGKGSFLVSARRTYFDLFLGLVPNTSFGKDNFFYDFNLKAHYDLNENNSLSFSGYLGEDRLQIRNLFGTKWVNRTGTLRWSSRISPRLFSNMTLITSKFSAESEVNLVSPRFGYLINYSLNDLGIKEDLEYYVNKSVSLEFGAEVMRHAYFFGDVLPSNSSSIVESQNLDPAFALESSAYFEINAKTNKGFQATVGLRYSTFNNLGAASVYLYDDSGVFDESTIIDTIQTQKGRSYFYYHGPEPRLTLRYALNDSSALKFTYHRTRQYLHLLSNTNTPTPVDMWAPVNPYIRPQIADQLALGYFRNFHNRVYEASLEVYYKGFQNQIDFKPLASLLLNNHLETEVLSGKGEAYGAEFFLRKVEGKRLTGWLTYTLSKSVRQIDGINQNRPYPTSFDRRHNFFTALNYKAGKRVRLSANWTYSSGIAFSFPVGKYAIGNNVFPYFSSRNGFRLPANHRLDLSITVYRERTKDQPNESSFTFSLYNAYFRKNAIAYVFRQSDSSASATETVKLFLPPTIPSFTYNFKF